MFTGRWKNNGLQALCPCVSWLLGPWEEVHQAQRLGTQSSESIHHNVNCGNFTDGLSWSPITFLLIKDGALEETSGLRSAGSTWFTPMLEIRTVSRLKLLKSLVPLLISLLQKTKTKMAVLVKQSLTQEIHSILYFCWGHWLLSCLLESVQSQTPGRKEQSC